MKKNIAVVGCGHWGKNLVRNFSNLGVLASICDPDINIAKKYAEQYKVKISSYNEVINDFNINGIVLSVPAHLHALMAIEAMNAGKHVFVEKPLAMNETEAKLMIETAKKKNVKLMVGHLLQFHPIFKTIRKKIKNKEIGELNYIYSNRLSFGKLRSEEDVIWSFAPHDISMILSLTDSEPEQVSIKSASIIQKDISDISSIHMEFKSGLKSRISVSWLHPYKEHKLIVIGSKAMIEFDDTKPWNKKLALYPYNVDFSEGSINLKKHEIKFIEVSEEEPLNNECQHFIDVVNKDINPITDGAEGLRVLKVLSAASESLNKKETVKM